MHTHVCMGMCVCENIHLYRSFHNASLLSTCTSFPMEVYMMGQV